MELIGALPCLIVGIFMAFKTEMRENEEMNAALRKKQEEENKKALRGELGRQVASQLRIVPEIDFLLDTTLDYAEHIDELLRK